VPQMPALSDEGLKELLSQPLVSKLATTSQTGDVRITPIWFRSEPDGSILMNTFEESAAVRNLTRNPSCSLLVDSTEWPYTGVHFWGRAASEGPENDEDGMAEMFGPYLGDRMDPNEYARLLIGWGTRVYVRFRPERKTTWDFRRG
jgi:hypothetical protein